MVINPFYYRLILAIISKKNHWFPESWWGHPSHTEDPETGDVELYTSIDGILQASTGG
jgi:hypothetical protein